MLYFVYYSITDILINIKLFLPIRDQYHDFLKKFHYKNKLNKVKKNHYITHIIIIFKLYFMFTTDDN